MAVKHEKNIFLGCFLDDDETPLQHFAEDFQLIIVILGKLGKRKVVKVVGQQIGHLKQFDPVGGGTEQQDGRVARKGNFSGLGALQFLLSGVVRK
jgi:hypothetical protein